MKAVIFDCFGVLTVDSWTTYLKSLPKLIQEKIEPLISAYDRGILAEEKLFKEVQALSGDSYQQISEAMAPEQIKNRGLFKDIVELRNMGFKIGMLSNINDDWVTEEFLSKDESEMFDAIVLSHHIGAVKPKPAAYLAIAERLQVQPNDCIMIDDSDLNCRGAEAVGMKAIVYFQGMDVLKSIDTLIQRG